ncbi:MAG: hypothetical protein QM775_10325 [Pirellulales bacterium]
MKTYAAQYDDDIRAGHEPKPIVILRTNDLGEAIKAADHMPERRAYVLHVASELQRYVFEGRAVWLDSHGVERPAPSEKSGR